MYYIVLSSIRFQIRINHEGMEHDVKTLDTSASACECIPPQGLLGWLAPYHEASAAWTWKCQNLNLLLSAWNGRASDSNHLQASLVFWRLTPVWHSVEGATHRSNGSCFDFVWQESLLNLAISCFRLLIQTFRCGIKFRLNHDEPYVAWGGIAALTPGLLQHIAKAQTFALPKESVEVLHIRMPGAWLSKHPGSVQTATSTHLKIVCTAERHCKTHWDGHHWDWIQVG